MRGGVEAIQYEHQTRWKWDTALEGDMPFSCCRVLGVKLQIVRISDVTVIQ